METIVMLLDLVSTVFPFLGPHGEKKTFAPRTHKQNPALPNQTGWVSHARLRLMIDTRSSLDNRWWFVFSIVFHCFPLFSVLFSSLVSAGFFFHLLQT